MSPTGVVSQHCVGRAGRVAGWGQFSLGVEIGVAIGGAFPRALHNCHFVTLSKSWFVNCWFVGFYLNTQMCFFLNETLKLSSQGKKITKLKTWASKKHFVLQQKNSKPTFQEWVPSLRPLMVMTCHTSEGCLMKILVLRWGRANPYPVPSCLGLCCFLSW